MRKMYFILILFFTNCSTGFYLNITNSNKKFEPLFSTTNNNCLYLQIDTNTLLSIVFDKVIFENEKGEEFISLCSDEANKMYFLFNIPPGEYHLKNAIDDSYDPKENKFYHMNYIFDKTIIEKTTFKIDKNEVKYMGFISVNVYIVNATSFMMKSMTSNEISHHYNTSLDKLYNSNQVLLKGYNYLLSSFINTQWEPFIRKELERLNSNNS